MTDFLKQLGETLLVQIIGLFGLFFLFCLILSQLQKWTQQNYFKSIGWKGILWTAWLGTPIHEYSHALVAKIFRHKIDKIALFQPNEETGQLGYVNHSYNGRSFYQNLGTFFISAAPMIVGSLILVLLLNFLVPNSQDVFSPLKSEYNLQNLASVVKTSLLALFARENLSSPLFWLFLYLSFCIASHLAPSRVDQKGIIVGLGLIILIILLPLNIIFILFKIDSLNYMLWLSKWLGIFTAIFAYATLISALHFSLTKILFLPFKKR